jgi:hypothetical protein
LDLIFSDVWGPAPTSVGRYSYYVSFIDDHSKFTWIYLLKHKSEVFAHFREFQSLVERQFDRKIRAMQTDWGGEYQSLNSFFKQVGIAHHVSCPHTHQQNGSTERKHRHIVEVGLTLLAHASMPLKFWDEAFLTAVFLINRLPNKVLQNKTPIFRLLGEEPDYTFLRTFGSACWPHLRPYNTRKLQFRSKQCVFLGYSNMHKGFKCLDPKEGRVYISRDVIFDEHVFPFAHLHPNVGAKLRTKLSLLPDILHNSSSIFGDARLHDKHADSPNRTNTLPCEDVMLSHAGANLETNAQHAEENRPDFHPRAPYFIVHAPGAGYVPAQLSGQLVSAAAPGGSSIAEIGSTSPPEATDMPQVDLSGPAEVDSPAASTTSARGSSASVDGSHAHVDPLCLHQLIVLLHDYNRVFPNRRSSPMAPCAGGWSLPHLQKNQPLLMMRSMIHDGSRQWMPNMMPYNGIKLGILFLNREVKM